MGLNSHAGKGYFPPKISFNLSLCCHLVVDFEHCMSFSNFWYEMFYEYRWQIFTEFEYSYLEAYLQKC